MNENRREPRSEEQADVSVKIASAPDVQNLEGKIFKSQSEDVSLGGMKLNIDTPIPVGAHLDLEVILNNTPEKFQLSANVVWADSTDLEATGHDMGVILNIESNSQFESWSNAISNL
jgi:Tfp pilus assembly protein PilZ